MSEESTNAADVRVGEPVVRIEGLRKSFGDNVVLRGIDLEVQRGEVVVILGPSGSGKSTLLRCVNLLETPTDGRIFFEDTEITAKKTDINKVRAKVGMVFQNFNLFPHLTAKKNVMLAQQKVLHRAKEEAEAEKLLRDAHLLSEAGCFGIVLEKIPAALAARVTAEIPTPTIGIGAGAGCDGQVLVIHDMLGINKGFSPRFLRRYADLHTVMTGAVEQYVRDVKECDFPNEKEQY